MEINNEIIEEGFVVYLKGTNGYSNKPILKLGRVERVTPSSIRVRLENSARVLTFPYRKTMIMVCESSEANYHLYSSKEEYEYYNNEPLMRKELLSKISENVSSLNLKELHELNSYLNSIKIRKNKMK